MHFHYKNCVRINFRHCEPVKTTRWLAHFYVYICVTRLCVVLTASFILINVSVVDGIIAKIGYYQSSVVTKVGKLPENRVCILWKSMTVLLMDTRPLALQLAKVWSKECNPFFLFILASKYFKKRVLSNIYSSIK